VKRRLTSWIPRDNWARNISSNKNVKVYIGAPASSSAAGGGYVDAGTMKTIANKMRKSFPSFGGVMLWDASQAYGTFYSVLIGGDFAHGFI
jgi:chitinase